MKTYLVTPLFCLLILTGFSQNYRYEYNGRRSASIEREKLKQVKFINEIMPGFSRFVEPYKERVLLNEQLRSAGNFNGFYTYPQELYDHSLENYNKIIYFVSIDISSGCNGKLATAHSTSDILTAEQKNILNTADLGSDISIKIRYKYKNHVGVGIEDRNTKEGEYMLTIVPAKEAEYSGGFVQMSEYLLKNVYDKTSGKSAAEKISKAIVKFTIDEQGQVVEVKIARTSTDQAIDKLLLEAITKMPKWKPAENAKGKKVKQEFNIPLGFQGC